MLNRLVIAGIAVAGLAVSGCVGFGTIVDNLVEHEARIGSTEKQIVTLAKDVEEIKAKGAGALSAKDALDVEKLIEDVEKLKEAHPEVE